MIRTAKRKSSDFENNVVKNVDTRFRGYDDVNGYVSVVLRNAGMTDVDGQVPAILRGADMTDVDGKFPQFFVTLAWRMWMGKFPPFFVTGYDGCGWQVPAFFVYPLSRKFHRLA